MDREGILGVLSEIKVELVQVGSRNIQCQCFLKSCEVAHRHVKRRASMGISISPDGVSLVNCLSCKFGGTLLYSVSKYSYENRLDLSKLLERIAKLEKQDPEALLEQILPYESPFLSKPEIIFPDTDLFGIAKTNIIPRYVLNRGLDMDTLRIWECSYDTLRKRAVFPVRNYNKNLVGAVGRTINGHEIKYYNYFNFDKSRYLFGEHLVKGPKLIVVEGLLDTVSVWGALRKENALDEYSVVGLLGSDPSKIQIQKIRMFSNEVVTFLDNDLAGLYGNRQLTKELSKSVLFRSVKYPEEFTDGGDPDDVVRKGFSVCELADAADFLTTE